MPRARLPPSPPVCACGSRSRTPTSGGSPPSASALLAGATLTAGPGRVPCWACSAGLAFFVPVLSWSGVYVGALPWFALATLEALYIARCRPWSALPQRLTAAGRTVAAYARRAAGAGWCRRGARRHPLRRVPLGATGVQPGRQPAGPRRPLARGARGDLRRGRRRHAAASPRPTAAAHRSWVRAAGAAVPVAVALVARRAAAPSPLPTDGRAVTVGFVQGNVPQAGLEFNAQRRAVLDNHVNGTEQLATPRRRTTSPDLVVWPENSSDIDPFRNADAAAADRQRPHRRRRAAADRGRARRAAGAHLERHRCSTCPAVADRSATSSCTRCPSPSTSRSGPSSGCSPRWPTSSGQLRRRPRGRRLHGAGASGGDYVALPDDLLRGGLRRPDARQRPGRRCRRQPARGADQQRHLRLHRRVRAAVRHLPDPRHRARPLGRARLDRRGVRRSIAPDGSGHREDRVVHQRRPAGGQPGGAHRADPGRPARARAPEWIAAAALLLPPRREHPGGPER